MTTTRPAVATVTAEALARASWEEACAPFASSDEPDAVWDSHVAGTTVERDLVKRARRVLDRAEELTGGQGRLL